MKKLKASDVIEIDDDFINVIAKRTAELNFTSAEDSVKTYSAKEVALRVKKDVNTIRIHIRNYINETPGAKLKAFKIGKTYYVAQQDLQKYLNG